MRKTPVNLRFIPGFAIYNAVLNIVSKQDNTHYQSRSSSAIALSSEHRNTASLMIIPAAMKSIVLFFMAVVERLISQIGSSYNNQMIAGSPSSKQIPPIVAPKLLSPTLYLEARPQSSQSFFAHSTSQQINHNARKDIQVAAMQLGLVSPSKR